MASAVAEPAESTHPGERSGTAAKTLRWLCLLVLLAAVSGSLPTVFPRHDSFARALYDIQHGNSSVVYIEKLAPNRANGPVRVVWQTDRLSWHQADVPAIPSPDCDSVLMLEPMDVSGGGLTVTVYRGGRCWDTTFDEAWQLTDAAAWYDPQLGPERHVDRRTFARPEVAGLPIDISLSTAAIHRLGVLAVALVSSGVLVGMMLRGRRGDAKPRARFWLIAAGWTVALTAAARGLGWAASHW